MMMVKTSEDENYDHNDDQYPYKPFHPKTQYVEQQLPIDSLTHSLTDRDEIQLRYFITLKKAEEFDGQDEDDDEN